MLPTFQSYGLRLTAHDQARLELDPRFREGDRAIAEYHDRAEGMLPEVCAIPEGGGGGGQ